jgi:hypothetical protein
MDIPSYMYVDALVYALFDLPPSKLIGFPNADVQFACILMDILDYSLHVFERPERTTKASSCTAYEHAHAQSHVRMNSNINP